MTSNSFAAALMAHLNSGRRIFEKPISFPPRNTLFFSANVALDPDSDEEENDVYVEIRLRSHSDVIVCDAHNHPDRQPRLPK